MFVGEQEARDAMLHQLGNPAARDAGHRPAATQILRDLHRRIAEIARREHLWIIGGDAEVGSGDQLGHPRVRHAAVEDDVRGAACLLPVEAGIVAVPDQVELDRRVLPSRMASSSGPRS